MIKNIFKALDLIVPKSISYNETWGNITITINHYEELSNAIKVLSEALLSYNPLLIPRITASDLDVDISEIDDYENTILQIIVNKQTLTIQNDFNLHFFYERNSFEQWLTRLNPFGITEYEKIKIIVHDIGFTCGGTNLLISDNQDDDFDNFENNIPDNEIAINYVSIPNGRNITFNTSKYLITFLNLKTTQICDNDNSKKYFEICLKNSAATLCATFASELDNNSVVLQGVRRLKLQLYDDATKIKLDLVLLLIEIVNWIYQDIDSTKIKIRIKLLLDRITLDIDYEKPLLNDLSIIIKNSYEQAKERYHFVMLERRDAYARELRNLLKDIKGQSDMYTVKIRALLSNLMRDVLAGLLFVGFTLFTKFTEIQKLLEHEKLISVLFRGLAIYFIISALMQIITDVTDLYMSKKELKYWSKTTSELLPYKELKEHINNTLNGRIFSAKIFYTIIMLLYLIVIYSSWNFPCLWQTYLK